MSLKILLVIEACGGAGRHILDLSRGLIARGVSVSLIWSPTRAEDSFVEAVDRIEGLNQMPMQMGRAIGLGDLTGYAKLHKQIRQMGPFDIIHAHSSKAGGLVRLMPPWVKGKRVYTPHAFRTMDTDLTGMTHLFYAGIERGLAYLSDAVITVGAQEFDHARKLGIPANKLHKIINGIKAVTTKTREDIRGELGLRSDQKVFGSVGRLSPQKDPIRFVEAINIAHRKNPDILGLVVGDGDLREAVEAKVEGVSCIFTGWADARALMPAMDALVMTSLYEAMPYTLLEAISAGLPIISTEVGGTQETIKPYENGFLLPANALAEAFAEAICRMTEGRRLHSYGEFSSKLAENYTIDAMVDQTLGVYQDLQSR